MAFSLTSTEDHLKLPGEKEKCVVFSFDWDVQECKSWRVLMDAREVFKQRPCGKTDHCEQTVFAQSHV